MKSRHELETERLCQIIHELETKVAIRNQIIGVLMFVMAVLLYFLN